MGKVRNIESKLDALYQWLSCLFALSIALPRPLSTWVFSIWGLFTLGIIIYDFIEKKHAFKGWGKADLPCLLLLALSLLGLISAGVAEHPDLVFRKTFGPRFSLIILPAFALLLRRAVDTRAMLKYFVAGNALSIALSVGFVALSMAFCTSPYTDFWSSGAAFELYRDFFSNFTEVCTDFTHRTYSGLNILLSYVAIAYLVNGRSLSKREALVWILYLAVSLAFLLLNNSRIITLCLPLLGISLWLCGARLTRRKCLIGGGVILLVIVALFILPTRLNQLLTEGGLGGMLANDPRAEIWPSVWELIRNKPFIGYGLDNIESPLVSLYLEHGFKEGVACAYAPHNEYLSEWAQMGILGVLLLVAILVFWAISSNKKERILIYPAVLIFSVVFLTESLLDRYMGCLSFAFFLFLTHGIRKREESPGVGEKYLGGLMLFLLIALSVGLGSALRATCFAPREMVKESNCIDKSEGLLYRVCKQDAASFIHQGNCVNRAPYAFCNLKEGENVRFSVSCRCTPDFDGQVIKLIAEKDLPNGTHIPTECAYDLTRKGEWQTLSVDVTGRQTILIYFLGEDKIRFEEFSGNVYFKNPCFINN
ncbi:MAG: O-antigen ligase family protein [Paludibacteraceae bacterium]|nr:O-antigen ligase family protein [Paludibacteraceae bacterium]MBP5481147.1 O-antigen ligase family protein [Paludibacteraceae bacterium]